MSEEEVPFKSIKITLSEEALMILEYLKKIGYFRSYSMTVEESIRALYDVLLQISLANGYAKNRQPIPDKIKLEAARNIAVRLARFKVTKVPKK